jgi:hypothetical protein
MADDDLTTRIADNQRGTQMTTKPKTRKAPAKYASDHVCTPEEAAALNFEPWKDGYKFPTREEINNPHLIACRAAYALMFKSKPEIIEIFKRAKDIDEGEDLHRLYDSLESAQEFFKGMIILLESASARMLVAGSSYLEQSHDRGALHPRTRHHRPRAGAHRRGGGGAAQKK